MSDEPARQQHLLLKVVSRFDYYIGSMNAKAALVAAFNTFLVGLVVLSWTEVMAAFENHPHAAVMTGVLLWMIAISALLSLGAAFLAIKPFRRSPKAPQRYHSIFFFGHVAEHLNGADYLSAVADATPDAVVSDLAVQAHALATGLQWKSTAMNISVLALVIGSLVPAGVVLLLKLIVQVLP